MARKKIVFVIVEGSSDDEALGLLIEKIYNKNTVYVHITHCDITTESGAKAINILSKIGGIVDSYAKSNHLSKSHFQEIVHIVDMDGAYIPDNAVTKDECAKKPQYSTTEIRTARPDGIISRNATKRACLDKISSTAKVWGVPYQAYYMSCNLDHVLYNKLNSSDDQKETDAFAFAMQYKENVQGFIDFISNSDFSARGNYLESWAYIKQDKHSLERHTNFNICVSKALESNFKTKEN